MRVALNAWSARIVCAAPPDVSKEKEENMGDSPARRQKGAVPVHDGLTDRTRILPIMAAILVLDNPKVFDPRLYVDRAVCILSAAEKYGGQEVQQAPKG
jgi:hypothetical protein